MTQAMFPGVTVRTHGRCEGIPTRPGVVVDAHLDGLVAVLRVHYGDQEVTAPESYFERLRAPLVPSEAIEVLDRRGAEARR